MSRVVRLPPDRIRWALAWVVGVIGGVATLVSLLPALTVVAASIRGTSALGFQVATVIMSIMFLSVPLLLAMAIGNVKKHGWVWLIFAGCVVVVLILARPSMGSLGVFWLSL